MPQLVPTSRTPLYPVTALEGANYLLFVRFQPWCACWYLSIATGGGRRHRERIKLITNWPLLRKFADPRLPQGELMCVTFGADQTMPTIGELGEGLRCQLFYFTGDELP